MTSSERKWADKNISIFWDDNFSREDYQPDGLHFNSRGTAKYTHEIRHIVRSVKSR